MRSPPPSQVAVSDYVSPSKPLRKSSDEDLTFLKSSRDLTNEDVLPFVPECLRPLLHITSGTNEAYAVLQESRERRFRRLLRRFTNQIQYGCQNPRCETPTCLSYRKRLSSGPLRPYSDVAARALAWKCVEQFASSARDLDHFDTDNSIKSMKSKKKGRQIDNRDGLCCNPPVVPWYEEPNEYFRRREAAFKYKTKYNERQKEGKQEEPSKRLSDLNELYKHKTTVDEAADLLRGKSQTTSDTDQYEVTPGNEQRLQGHDDQDQDGSLPRPCAAYEKQWYSPKRDPASFTQFLFNVARVNKLSSTQPFPRHSSPGNAPEPSQDLITEEANVTTSAATANEDKARLPYALPSCAHHVQTFRILPASAVLWLRMRLCNQNNEPLLTKFAQQSLHFALSNPLRLIESATTWDCFWQSTAKDFETSSTSKSDTALITRVQDLNDLQNGTLGSSLQPILPSWDSVERICLALADISFDGGTTIIANHIFAALQHAYIAPKWLRVSQPRLLESPLQASEDVHFLSDNQTSHLLLLAISIINGLTAKGPSKLDRADSRDYNQFHVIHPSSFIAARGTGQVYPQSAILQMYRHLPEDTRVLMCQDYLRLTFSNNDPSISRLSDSIADIISHRIALSEINKVTNVNQKDHESTSIIDEIIKSLLNPPVLIEDNARFITMHHSLRLLIFMQSVILAKWDKRPIIRRVGPVGGALKMLAGMYRQRQHLQFDIAHFQMQFVANSLDEVDMPYEWLSFRQDNKKMHILQFTFLFDPATLVRYFRAINLKLMQHAHEHALAVYINAKSYLVHTLLPVYGSKEILDKIRPHMARYFVMTISRKNVLADAIDQIWRRERQEIMRPLKVRVGQNEGEDGLDHGGVQQEFFRLVFAEALNPDLGMFEIDDATRMAWFQPGSLEPLYKFEALGILMSLAVYNAITLPLTFPLAFYRKLLDLKVKRLEHIEDGWPGLSRSLQTLLDWKDGDVGDSIMRTYEFSYNAFGTIVTVDMEKVSREDVWPPLQPKKSRDGIKSASFEFPPSPLGTPSPANSPVLKPSLASVNLVLPSTKGTSTPLSLENEESEAALVTNANRDQYVRDYIFWLTDKSIRPQFEAFAKGFYACLNRTALSIFTPEALKQVIEGHQDIDIDGLERTASYDDYEVDETFIRDFWNVVRDFAPEQHRKLLEFVTASDRVPVNGIESVTFTIQKNGEGDDRLPSSSTCYGRLLLPHYSTKEILKAKLEKAIENSVGFGSL